METWDENDTVTINPYLDPHIFGYIFNLPEVVYSPTWYEKRVYGGEGPKEKKAAKKAAAHAGTPHITFFDTLGRAYLSIDDNGGSGKYLTRIIYDIEGNQRSVTDAKERDVMLYDFDMLGTLIRQRSMEAGEQRILNNCMGKALLQWNSRGYRIRTINDTLQRPSHIYLTSPGMGELLVERIYYGESHPDMSGNLRGRMWCHFEQSGLVVNEYFDFKGNLTDHYRRFAGEYKNLVDWSALESVDDPVYALTIVSSNLESESFTSHTRFDALNRPILLLTPHWGDIRPNVIQPSYNEANLLEKIDVWLRKRNDTVPESGILDPATADRHIVTDIDYNAKGQREAAFYGNGTQTVYGYDRETYRLTRLTTTKAAEIFQDISYVYDPVGNITSIADDAQQEIYFHGGVTYPESEYWYDPLYRLTKSTGREFTGINQNGGQQPPSPPDHAGIPHCGFPVPDGNIHPHDGQAVVGYEEEYVYDAVGNFERMIHRARSGNWTRHYVYNETSLLDASQKGNRLSATRIGSGTPEPYLYDGHGNITAMPHLPVIQWDYRDQLRATARQAANGGTPETTYYVYDASGQRVRKVTESYAAAGVDPVRMKERMYLGGFELYREYENSSADVKLERESLQVTDDKRMVALVETKTKAPDDDRKDLDVPLVRYQYTNHLGSACLELDDRAVVVSYEEYFPYGCTSFYSVNKEVRAAGKRYRYSGKERDEETGFYYYGARYYSSWLGRWLSCDPAGLVDGSNLYEYVRGNPIGMKDATGLASNPPDPQYGNVSPYRNQPKAVKVNDVRITENEHVVNKATLQEITNNPQTGPDYTESHYKSDETVRIERETALDKTHGNRGGATADNARLAQMRSQGGRIDVNEEVMGRVDNMKRARTKMGSVVTDAEINRSTLGQLGNLFGNQSLAESGAKVRALQPTVGERSASMVKGVLSKARSTMTKVAENPRLIKAGAKLAKAGKQFVKAVPFIGVGAGVAGAAYAASQGDTTTAALDTAGMIPVAGDLLDAARGGYALGEAVGELLVDSDKAMAHGEAAMSVAKDIGLNETASEIFGGVVTAGSAIAQASLKTSPIGFLFW